MLKYNGCPRCDGAVLNSAYPTDDGPTCVNCGWRQYQIPEDILAEVAAQLGKPQLEGERYARHRIGTGRVAPTGWERLKKRR